MTARRIYSSFYLNWRKQMKYPREDFENFCRKYGHVLQLNALGGYRLAQTKVMYRAWMAAYDLYAPKTVVKLSPEFLAQLEMMP
jgi:hypothetical protein